MENRYTAEQLNSLSKEQLIGLVIGMQKQLDGMNQKLEDLIEQIRIANSYRFGRKTEKLSQIDGQLSLFNEVEASADESVPEPEFDEVVIKRKKKRGQRKEDLRDLPHESVIHRISDDTLDDLYGKGCWKRIPSDTYQRVRIQPARWIVEDHEVQRAVGTRGDHQDEFISAEHPRSLFRDSIATESLVAAIDNAKYVNALPINRIMQEFERNGVFLSKQTMANWSMYAAERFLAPLWDRLKEIQLSYPVNQCDETPCQVIHDNDPDDPEDRKRAAGHKNYMWVHLCGEFYRDRPIILYEYQRGRSHNVPQEYYKNYRGILETDGLQQYHLIAENLPDVTSANCWAHARRDYADAIKAIGSKNTAAVRTSTAYQALERIGTIYKLEEGLAGLSAEERLNERKKNIGPLVEEYFAWVKSTLHDGTVLPRGKTADGLNYSVNQEKYLRVFLTDGNVPIDNSASERAVKPFVLGKKNWMFINTVRGAHASAITYSITETAKANGLNPFYYLEHIFSVMKDYVTLDENRKPDFSMLPKSVIDELLPWSPSLPEKCQKPRR
ncbi:MAG: IS66 family transposase [Lachnospiraceae bacterium]|nr:IS66 family transposase [Lachnospiraceae bacterium]